MNDFFYNLSDLIPVNAFLNGLPMVLDRNFALGNIIMPVVLRLLRYMPLPLVDDKIPLRMRQHQLDSVAPRYTLGLLNTQARYAWINSLIIILYKYQYTTDSNDPLSTSQIIKNLIQISINTLKGLFHKCEITAIDPVRLDSDLYSLLYGLN
jgi:hypothetical protein